MLRKIKDILVASPFGSGHSWLRFTSVSSCGRRLPCLRPGPLLPLTLQSPPVRTLRSSRLLFASIVLSFLICFNSCERTHQYPFGSYSLITGLATPIVLEPDTTIVYLADYFDVLTEIQELHAPAEIEVILGEEAGVLKLVALEGTPPLSILSVTSKSGQDYQILLKRSFKKPTIITFNPGEMSYQLVQVAGDINAWNASSTTMELKDGIYMTQLFLNPGIYGYQLELDGMRALNPDAPTMDNGMGGVNSRLAIEAPSPEELPYVYTSIADGSKFTLGSARAPGRVMVFWENSLLADTVLSGELTFNIPFDAKKITRSHIRVFTYNDNGLGNDLLIPVQEGKVLVDPEQLTREDLHRQIMYFLMVDRFQNGDPTNDRPEDDPMVHPLANFKGGDLAGVIQRLESGFFDSLGMNTIWLSPIPRNPEGVYGLWDQGGVKSTFSSYHGYWPTGLSDVDPRFGTKEEFRRLVELAHEKDMAVILDFVAHHIHESHPLYEEKKGDNWFTDLYLPDGSLNTERWDDHRLTTWFDVFLPTFNFFNPEVNEMLSDTAMYWLLEFGIDGFRHDATKHIHLDFWRTLTRKVKDYRRQQNRTVYQVGETYGTPDLIASYISTGLLDAQFDFNLFDAALAALCRKETDFSDLQRRLEQSFQYYGYNHLMGNMSGNQDRARFMAYATGEIAFEEDAKLAGWTRDIEKRTQEGFDKLAQMHAFNLTIPGIPCIYYGDDIGMTGGNDPDNRRMMYFEGWNTQEQQLFKNISTLATLRQNHLGLLYGDFQFLDSGNKKVLSFVRSYFGKHAIVVLNKSDESVDLSIPLPAYLNQSGLRTLDGSPVTVKESAISINVPPRGFQIVYN